MVSVLTVNLFVLSLHVLLLFQRIKIPTNGDLLLDSRMDSVVGEAQKENPTTQDARCYQELWILKLKLKNRIVIFISKDEGPRKESPPCQDEGSVNFEILNNCELWGRKRLMMEIPERKAPLASMEDLTQSQFNTPQQTPAPSPR